MKKFILMSIMVGALWIPIAAAMRYSNAKLGVRKVQKQFFVFVMIYVLTVLYVLPRL